MKVHVFSLAITALLQHTFEFENVFCISFVNTETYKVFLLYCADKRHIKD